MAAAVGVKLVKVAMNLILLSTEEPIHLVVANPVSSTLQLLLGSNQLLHLGELVIVLETLRVSQRAARLDGLPGHDLLDGQLDLFEVDGCLRGRLVQITTRNVGRRNSPESQGSQRCTWAHASCSGPPRWPSSLR